MPYPRPTITALRTQAMQDIIASDLPNADGFLRRSALRVMAWVQAGLAYLHYGYLDWIAQQATPATATAEYLEFWAALAPTPVLRLPPQPAVGQVTFSGTNATPIPAGTIVLRQSDGAQFATTSAASVASNVAQVPVSAVVAGSAGNTDAGAPMQIQTPIAGINSVGSAATALTGGTDLEVDTSLRSRMLESYASPPAGGAAADYVTWALEVPGVTRAWALPNSLGPGTVSVYFMMDVTEAAHSGFPQGTNGVAAAETRATVAAGDQLTVANGIYPLRPVTALVYACAPSAMALNFTISGLTSATSGQQAAVSAALSALLTQLGNPLSAASINQSDVDAAISAVAGLPKFAVTIPAAWPVTPPVGSMFVLGTVTFI